MSVQDSLFQDLDDVYFIQSQNSMETEKHVEILELLSNPLDTKLKQIIKYTCVATILSILYHIINPDALPIDYVLGISFTLAGLTLLTKIRYRYSFSDGLNDFILKESTIKQSILIILTSLVVFTSIGSYLLYKYPDVRAETVYVSFALILTIDLLQDLLVLWAVRKKDEKIKSKIRRNEIDKEELHSEKIVDKNGNVIRLDLITYTIGDDKRVISKKINSDAPSVENIAYFDPHINEEKLGANEELITYTEYIWNTLGDPLNTNQSVEVVTRSAQESEENEIIQKVSSSNPYNLSAEDLRLLEENNLVQDYFEKYS